MKTFKRALLSAFAASVLAVAITPAQAQDTAAMFGEIAVDKVSDSLYSLRRGAYRAPFYVTDEGVVVFDPMDPRAANYLRIEIGKVTTKPVKYVVYTTSLRDRVSGARIFKNEGAQIISQEKCAENMRETPFQDALPPDLTYKDKHEIKLGGKQVDLHYFGPANDTCQSVVVFKDEKVLFLSNVVVPPGPAVPWNSGMANIYMHNLIPFLKKVEDLAAVEGITQNMGAFISVDVTPERKLKILPPVGPIAAVRQQREFWEAFYADVKAEMAKGATAATISDRLDYSKYKYLRRYNEDALKVVAKRVLSYYTTGR
ncbi:MAG: hypothetical protein JNM81_16190 [Rhodospirillaceae bacterium]|nr:hypothetical protein [Rhodospirillaceae bacterium]